MATMRIRWTGLRLFNLQTRLPFKYGIATMTRVPQLFLRLDLEISGDHRAGVSADLLPPKWFTKDPAKPLAAELEPRVSSNGWRRLISPSASMPTNNSIPWPTSAPSGLELNGKAR